MNRLENMRQILRDSGLDVDIAVENILKQQKEKRQTLETEAEFGTIEDIMTSELVYKSNNLDDVFGREYKKRLNLIELNENKINSLYEQEKLILSCNLGIFQSHRELPWVRRYFFNDGITEKDLPKFGQMTLSELVIVTDDASSAFVRDHHVLSPETWSAVCKAAVQSYSFGGAQYALAFKDRVKKLGWSEEQEGAYIKNECLLTERLKWGYHEKPAWTSETANSEQFKE